MGGEKSLILVNGGAFMGSPPHGRGKGIQPGNHRVAMGITPAWAGKRLGAHGAFIYCEDHPRMGGEKNPFG